MGYTVIIEVRRDGGLDEATLDVVRTWTRKTNGGLSEDSELIRWQDRDDGLVAFFKPGRGRAQQRDVRYAAKCAAELSGTNGLSVKVTDDLGLDHTVVPKKKKGPVAPSSAVGDIRSVEGGVALTFSNLGSACSAELTVLFDDADGNTLHTHAQTVRFDGERQRVMVVPVPAGAVKAEGLVRTKRDVRERGRVVEKWDGPGKELSFAVTPGGTVLDGERRLREGREAELGPYTVRLQKVVARPTPDRIAVQTIVRVVGPDSSAWLALRWVARDGAGRPVGGVSRSTHLLVDKLGGKVAMDFEVPATATLDVLQLHVTEWTVAAEHAAGPRPLPDPGGVSALEPDGLRQAASVLLTERDGKPELTAVVEVAAATGTTATELRLFHGTDLLAVDTQWGGSVPPSGAVHTLSLPLRQRREPNRFGVAVVELVAGEAVQIDVPFE